MTKRTVEYVVQGREKSDKHWYDVRLYFPSLNAARKSELEERKRLVWPLVRIIRRETIVKERIVK